jgi:hypothetical protein
LPSTVRLPPVRLALPSIAVLEAAMVGDRRALART